MMGRARPWLLLGWVALILAMMVGPVPIARAAAADQIDELDVTFAVQPDGSVKVTERILLRFGTASARRGLERWLIIRKPYDDGQDQLYQISDLVVTSPSNAPTLTVQSDVGEGRVQALRIRVGDANRPITQPTASYELHYLVRGALRRFGDHDDLYWDVTGDRLPRVVSASVQVEAPGGVDQVFCSEGRAPTTTSCAASSVAGGDGRYRAADLPPGASLIVAATFPPARVTDGNPILVENADVTAQRTRLIILALSCVLAVVIPLLGWWYYRRNGQDRRYAGLPPGTLPGPDETVPEVRDRGPEIPLASDPPALSLADAVLLLDGGGRARQTTATLIGLAVDGAIRFRGGHDPEARLVDARLARDRPSSVLLEELFEGGETVAGLSAGVLAEGHDRIAAVAAERAADEGWFIRMPRRRSAGAAVIAALGLGYAGYVVAGVTVLYVLPLLVSATLTAVVLIRALGRGQRTGRGRALTDQLEGFRRHLATVTADQLRADRGADIFSRRLPWAIAFNLTERWTRVCRQLATQGGLADVAPAWYDGTSWSLAGVGREVQVLNADVEAATRAPDLTGGTGRRAGSA